MFVQNLSLVHSVFRELFKESRVMPYQAFMSCNLCPFALQGVNQKLVEGRKETQ
jgi:hypothetical protein